MAVGDKLVTLDGLKAVYQDVNGNIVELQSEVNYLGKLDTRAITGWVIGGLNTGMNATNDNQNRVHIGLDSLPQIPSRHRVVVKIPNGFAWRVGVYTQKAYNPAPTIITGSGSSDYVAQDVVIPSEYAGRYLNFNVKKTDNSDFTQEEINALTGFSIEVEGILGVVSDLHTTDKSTIVDAINEVNDETGRLVNILVGLHNSTELNVLDLASSSYPTGWRPGRWVDNGSISSDDTAICLTGRIGIPGGNGQRSGAHGLYVTTTFGTIEVKRFNSGSLIETTTNSGRAYCAGKDGDLLSVTITGLTSPSSDYISNSSISNVHIYTLFADEHHSAYVNADYFTVPINSTWIDGNADEVESVNVDCVVCLPITYSPGGTPTRLVFMHHGSSGTVNVANQTWYSEVNSWQNMVNAYLNAGYAVFDVNGCGPVSDTNANHDYGAFGALQAAYKAYKYIINKYNIDKRIFVHGSSMGGATAYAFAKAYGSIVDAVGLFSPASLSRSAQMDSVDDYIAINYGYTDVAAMVADDYSHLISASPSIEYFSNGVRVEKPYTYDWVNDHDTDGLNIVCKDFSMPLKIWCGTSDTTVDPKYGEELAKAISAAGGLAIFCPVSGANHSACVGSNSTVNAEAVMWFDRFK